MAQICAVISICCSFGSSRVIMQEHLPLSKLNETESLPIKLNTGTHSTFYLLDIWGCLVNGVNSLSKDCKKSNFILFPKYFRIDKGSKAMWTNLFSLWKGKKNWVEASSSAVYVVGERGFVPRAAGNGFNPACRGPGGKGGGVRMETHNIQLHGAFTAAAKGDSDSSNPDSGVAGKYN